MRGAQGNSTEIKSGTTIWFYSKLVILRRFCFILHSRTDENTCQCLKCNSYASLGNLVASSGSDTLGARESYYQSNSIDILKYNIKKITERYWCDLFWISSSFFHHWGGYRSQFELLWLPKWFLFRGSNYEEGKVFRSKGNWNQIMTPKISKWYKSRSNRIKEYHQSTIFRL